MSILSKFKRKKTEETDKPAVKIKKGGKKKKIIIIVCLVLVVALCAVLFKACGKKDEASVVTKTAKVTRGDVEVTLTGSGTIEANEQYNITSLVKGDVTADYFEEGDLVQKGAVLYKIDASDMENNIQRSRDSLTKAQHDYSRNVEDSKKLTVTAPISGVVTKSYISKNDDVNTNENIVEITDNDTMILKVDFNASDRSALYTGAPARVFVDSSATELWGTISRISSGTVTNSKGASVVKVDIAVSNPGTVTPSATATAIACGVACNSSGTFEYNEVKTVKAEVGGTVQSVNFKEGDRIAKGQTIATLTSTNLDDSIFNSSMSVSDARLSLNSLYDSLEDYTITSPISGTVISKTTKAGDKLDNTSAQTVMAIVADMSIIKFDIAVDELDIAKVKVGQDVDITADALDGKTFTGYIDKISIVGTTNNGVTTYPVTVIVNDPDGLIPGMNVEATIVVDSAEDVLMIPSTALNRGNTVWVKKDSESAKNGKVVENKDANAKDNKNNDSAYAGYVQVEVETGLSNDSFVEIKSGLQENDDILITTVSSGKSIMEMMQYGGMQDGPGGGPNGGGPNGGGPGGGGAPGGGGPGGGGMQ